MKNRDVSLWILWILLGERVVLSTNSICTVALIEIKFSGLLALQNRVYYTQDVSFLNSFENVLTNEIV